MFGGVGKAGWATILVAGGLMLGSSVSAQAADLGGDCCSDLEERIAELEATAARKGNRKVSLEVSGHVNQAVMWWDDGAESNVYNVTNDNSRTRFRFKGKAKIDKDLSAGYLLEIGVRTANSKRVNQNDDEGCGGTGSDCGLDIRHSSWFIESKTYGTITLGRTGMATEGITELNLTQTADISKYSDVEDTGLGMFLRAQNGVLSGIPWYHLIGRGGDQPGEGDRQDAIRYDTPTFAGFYASAAYGEDDFWDLSLRYKGEHHGVKIAAGFGYGEITDYGTSSTDIGVVCPANFGTAGVDDDTASCHQWGGSISAIHEESGLFINAAAGEIKDDLIASDPAYFGLADDSSTFWAVQAGIEKKYFSLGKTTVWGQYYSYDGGANKHVAVNGSPFDGLLGTARLNSSELDIWGAGIAQGIDAAAMIVYLSYRHAEADLTLQQEGTANLLSVSPEDLDVVMGGGIIKF
jgi:predicted porin